MPLVLKTTITGSGDVIAAIDGIRGRTKDLQPAFKVAKLLILESVGRNFMAGGRPKWKRLAQLTVLSRMRKTKGYREYRSGTDKGRITAATARNIGAAGFQILRDSGALMNSLDLKQKQHPNIDVITHDTLSIGTNSPYAGVHQHGAPGIPSRPFMVLQTVDEERIVQIIKDHVMGDEQ